jgi:hypothetical protein
MLRQFLPCSRDVAILRQKGTITFEWESWKVSFSPKKLSHEKMIECTENYSRCLVSTFSSNIENALILAIARGLGKVYVVFDKGYILFSENITNKVISNPFATIRAHVAGSKQVVMIDDLPLLIRVMREAGSRVSIAMGNRRDCVYVWRWGYEEIAKWVVPVIEVGGQDEV